MKDLEKKIYVNSSVVNCAGENSTVGHPLVYLNMGQDKQIQCPYCNNTFYLQRKT